MPVRSSAVAPHHAGRRLLEVLTQLFKLSGPSALTHLRHRHVRINGKLCMDPDRRMRRGQRLEIDLPGRLKGGEAAHRHGIRKPEKPLPKIAKQIRLIYADDDILVVEKPAGLTTVRHAEETESLGRKAQRYLPPTLVDLLLRVLPRKYRGGRIRAVHRLDKETSGILVLAQTRQAEGRLGKQFRAHAVARTYLALVRCPSHLLQPLSPEGRGGTAGPASSEGQGELPRQQSERIESYLVHDRGDGRRGSSPTGEGQRAVTHVRVVEDLGGFALVECRLETGRTHQVRIHLGERGKPLCGERIYDRPPHGRPVPDKSGATRPMLHAATLALTHPVSGKRMEWASEIPEDMRRLLDRLRRKS